MKKKARYRAIPCFYDDVTDELIGRNWLYDILVSLNVWFDFEALKTEDLPLWVEADEEDFNNPLNPI